MECCPYKSHRLTHTWVYISCPNQAIKESVLPPLPCSLSPPPSTTHKDLGRSPISPGSPCLPFLLRSSFLVDSHVWIAWLTPGDFRPCILVPCSACLHLFTCLKLPTLALTPQWSSFLIIFYSDGPWPSWYSLNILLCQGRVS